MISGQVKQSARILGQTALGKQGEELKLLLFEENAF